MFRKYLMPKSYEVTGEWRKLHNEELHDLYYAPNILLVIKSRRMRWTGYVAFTREMRGAYRLLVGKPGGKRTLGRSSRRWEDKLKWILKKWNGQWTGFI